MPTGPVQVLTWAVYYDATVHPAEQVSLEREPENPHDEHAIRVENGRFEPVAHIPRHVSSWLAPLIDSGSIRADGHIDELYLKWPFYGSRKIAEEFGVRAITTTDRSGGPPSV